MFKNLICFRKCKCNDGAPPLSSTIPTTVPIVPDDCIGKYVKIKDSVLGKIDISLSNPLLQLFDKCMKYQMDMLDEMKMEDCTKKLQAGFIACENLEKKSITDFIEVQKLIENCFKGFETLHECNIMRHRCV